MHDYQDTFLLLLTFETEYAEFLVNLLVFDQSQYCEHSDLPYELDMILKCA